MFSHGQAYKFQLKASSFFYKKAALTVDMTVLSAYHIFLKLYQLIK